jgi:hypothetical protein
MIDPAAPLAQSQRLVAASLELFEQSGVARAEAGRLRDASHALRVEHERLQWDCRRRRRVTLEAEAARSRRLPRTIPSPWSSLPWSAIDADLGQPLELIPEA